MSWNRQTTDCSIFQTVSMSFPTYSHNTSHVDDVDNSEDLIGTKPIQDSIIIAFNLLKIPEARYSLYTKCSELILDDRQQIRECIDEALAIPYQLIVAETKGAIMQCNPHVHESEEGNHVIRFSNTYIVSKKNDSDSARRCTFMHVVKILHEIAHTITPSLVRRTEAYQKAKAEAKEAGRAFPLPDAPDRIDQVWLENRQINDFGLAFEQLVFGGRVVVGSTTGSLYEKNLKIIAVENAMDAPVEENYFTIEVADHRIDEILSLLDTWESGPFPDLSLIPVAARAGKRNAEEVGGMSAEPPTKKASGVGGVSTCIEGLEGAASEEAEEDGAEERPRGPTGAELEELRAMGQVLTFEQGEFLKNGGKI